MVEPAFSSYDRVLNVIFHHRQTGRLEGIGAAEGTLWTMPSEKQNTENGGTEGGGASEVMMMVLLPEHENTRGTQQSKATIRTMCCKTWHYEEHTTKG